MKEIILCADDYGQNEAISQAIIALLEKKRLSAVSCLTTVGSWQNDAQLLQPFQEQADIGLHFNLTAEQSLSSVLLAAHLHRLNSSMVERTLHVQLDAFEKALGRLPDFIDGHQHVHQLPVVREALFKIYETRLRPHTPYIRCVYFPKLSRRVRFKNLLIPFLTRAISFRKELINQQIPHNFSFSGIYNFANSTPFSLIFPTFLQEINEQGIIMCHPGLQNVNQQTDEIAKTRYQEFLYLESRQFLLDCEQAGVKLSRFKKPYRN